MGNIPRSLFFHHNIMEDSTAFNGNRLRNYQACGVVALMHFMSEGPGRHGFYYRFV